jgi:endonuclease YncB( thermonuclease family)
MKKLFNSSGLLIGLILIFIGILANRKTINSATDKAIASIIDREEYADEWQVKEGSIYDGDTLRVVKGNEELKIRFCGIDAPEIKQPLGIESRDYLRSLLDKSDGRIYVLPIEEDRYGRTIAELWIPLKENPEAQIHLNTWMVEAGMAWHYGQYSSNCKDAEKLAWAEENAREDKLGVWASNDSQPPWEWRKSHK